MIDPRERLILALLLAFAANGATLSNSNLHAEARDQSKLTVAPHLLDMTPREFVISGQEYLIPQNFSPSQSAPTRNKKGSGAKLVTLRAFLPDVTGLTQDDVPCLDSHSPCYDRNIRIGFGTGKQSSGTVQLQNIRRLINPERKVGRCGFEYYDSVGHPATRAIHFIYRSDENSDTALLRCFTYNSTLKGLCNASERIDGEHYYYYVFSSRKLCDWPAIRNKVLDRIVSFKKAAKPDRKSQ